MQQLKFQAQVLSNLDSARTTRRQSSKLGYADVDEHGNVGRVSHPHHTAFQSVMACGWMLWKGEESIREMPSDSKSKVR